MKQRQLFGGGWTEEKLERVQKYLVEYSKIMNKQSFRFAYMDAFAGTGYRTLKQEQNPSQYLFPELAAKDSQQFLDGSARIALQIRPQFTKYIFIEKDESRFAQLRQLKDDFPEVATSIDLVNADCNTWLQDRCLNYNWRKNRAVLFLDPFGMQIEWRTIEAIAQTKAIDLWLLFPLGVAVNRILRKDGQIDQALKERLNRLFGTEDWFDVFYQMKITHGLFGEEEKIAKVADLDKMGQYFVERLKTVFSQGKVAENPLRLTNSRNNPLYLLCFAAGNPKGAPTAVRIAEHILGK